MVTNGKRRKYPLRLYKPVFDGYPFLTTERKVHHKDDVFSVVSV